MAKIEDISGRESGGGYERLFNNQALGHLISRVHGATCRAGIELERIIAKKCTSIPNIDTFLSKEIMPEGVFLAPKRTSKQSKTLTFESGVPDFVVFKRRSDNQSCHIIELKDGDAFDTKKAQSENEVLKYFVGEKGCKLRYTVSAHICCFNQSSKEAIVKGFKDKTSKEVAMTGRELCDLLEIDYEGITQLRKKDAEENLEYFVRELLKIESLHSLIKEYARKYL